MDLYSAFRPMYLVSRFLGLFPFASRQRRTGNGVTYERSTTLQVYSFLLILSACIMVLASYGAATTLSPGLVSGVKDTRKSMFMDQIGYLICVVISFGDVFFSLTCAPRIRRIFLVLFKADEMLKYPVVPRDVRPRHYLLRRIAVLQIAMVLLVTVICDYNDYYTFGVRNPNTSMLAPIYILRLVTFFLEQQFVQIAFMFRERFVVINSSLKNNFQSTALPRTVSSTGRLEQIGGWSGQQHQRHLDRGLRDNNLEPFDDRAEILEKLRIAHAMLSEEILTLTRAYELPLITDLIMLFFDFISGGYFLISDVLNEDDMNARSLAWSWVIHSSLRIALLSWIAWESSIKAKMAGSLVVKLMKRNMNKDVRDELNVFLAQLSCNEVRFNLLGLFYLDMTVLQAMTQAATSYLVILLQFQTTQLVEYSTSS